VRPGKSACTSEALEGCVRQRSACVSGVRASAECSAWRLSYSAMMTAVIYTPDGPERGLRAFAPLRRTGARETRRGCGGRGGGGEASPRLQPAAGGGCDVCVRACEERGGGAGAGAREEGRGQRARAAATSQPESAASDGAFGCCCGALVSFPFNTQVPLDHVPAAASPVRGRVAGVLTCTCTRLSYT
jgi:hypothetical protein